MSRPPSLSVAIPLGRQQHFGTDTEQFHSNITTVYLKLDVLNLRLKELKAISNQQYVNVIHIF